MTREIMDWTIRLGLRLFPVLPLSMIVGTLFGSDAGLKTAIVLLLIGVAFIPVPQSGPALRVFEPSEDRLSQVPCGGGFDPWCEGCGIYGFCRRSDVFTWSPEPAI